MSMGVKSEKTFEEIVERLAALFRLKPRAGEREYEESVEADPIPEQSPAAQKPTPHPKDKTK